MCPVVKTLYQLSSVKLDHMLIELLEALTPLVGIAEPRSAMASPTTKIKAEATNQPHTRPTGPAGGNKPGYWRWKAKAP